MTWLDLPADHPYGIANLPYGVFSTAGTEPRVGVRVGDQVLDAGACAEQAGMESGAVWLAPSLNPFLAEGRHAWAAARQWLTEVLTNEAHRDAVEPHLLPLADVTLHLPVEVADYVDFYASEHHATNVGRIFRPDSEPLTPNWKHLPIGYHGRAGTIVVSGTDVVRPSGQRKPPTEPQPTFGPSVRLDIEAELGFVVGGATALGEPVPRRMPTSTCSASSSSTTGRRATSRPGSTCRSARSSASRSPPRSRRGWSPPRPSGRPGAAARAGPRAAALPARRAERRRGGHGLRARPAPRGRLERHGRVAAAVPRHVLVAGPDAGPHDGQRRHPARRRPVRVRHDLAAPRRAPAAPSSSCTWSGTEPVTLDDGSQRTFLEDGDTITLRATAPGPEGAVIGLGECVGTVLPAR